MGMPCSAFNLIGSALQSEKKIEKKSDGTTITTTKRNPWVF